jgi:hypothetical protein
MIETIIITACSTLVMVGLITSIAVVYYKLGKRLTKEHFNKEVEHIYSRIDNVCRDMSESSNELRNGIYQEFHHRDEDVHHVKKMIDSRVDKTNVRIDKLIKALEENGNTLKVTDMNI